MLFDNILNLSAEVVKETVDDSPLSTSSLLIFSWTHGSPISCSIIIIIMTGTDHMIHDCVAMVTTVNWGCVSIDKTCSVGILQ